jgi:hypothetical protein
LREKGQALVHPVIDTGMAVGELLVAMRNTKLVEPAHEPAGAVEQIELILLAAVDVERFQHAEIVRLSFDRNDRVLPTDWQTASAHHDRERINRARQDAEDLFKPRQQPTRAEVPTSAQNDALSAEHQPRRQPRVFMIPPLAPMTSAKVEPAAEPKAREIPASQFGRVRALSNYGMTQAQVADLYEVTIDAIDRIIRSPS